MRQVLLFSLTAMANPTLVAATTVMLLLPSPEKLMLGYLAGALITSITLGLVIVFAAESSGIVKAGKHSINPAADLAFGTILVAVGLALHAGRDRAVRDRRAKRKAGKPHKTPRWQRVLSKGDPKVTIAVGALLSLPGASYLAALTSIAKLKYNTFDTVLLVLMVNGIMLALLELPVISFAVAPKWTPAAIERVKAAFRRSGRKAAIIGVTVLGSLLILRGVITLISA
jgi:hypothetical protein